MSEPELITKSFPVLDCDAHIDDPPEIWTEYVDPEYRELVRRTFWVDGHRGMLNQSLQLMGHLRHMPTLPYNPISIAGPGMNKKLMRWFQRHGTTPEQRDYLDHRGAYDAKARLHDMDLMGIDQVVLIPTMMMHHLPHAESAEGAYAFCRAYNNWAHDQCKADPERIFAAALLPPQDPVFCAREIERVAQREFRVVLVRPIDARGTYPNRIHPDPLRIGAGFETMDLVYRTLEQTGLVLGMHTLGPSNTVHSSRTGSEMFSPGELLTRAGDGETRHVDGQTFGFVFEAMTWLSQVLLSGFLDRYPGLRMAVFESNAIWLPQLLGQCDRLFELYRNERRQPAHRRPSEAFREQCFIAFESDETPVFRQWDVYQDIGIWSSDAYHHDGADCWSAIREMTATGVPEAVQARMLGGNAARMYGIEPKLCVTQQRPIERPDWFPSDREVERWWQVEAYPRRAARDR